ncbi:hypothetical protein KR032_010605, partial [Drosophila birchii]
CSLRRGIPENADEYCNLVETAISCGLFVNLINFMKIFFCELELSFIPIYGLCNAIMLLALFGLLHMMTKYFFLPNILTLIQFTPATMFGSSFLISGPCLLTPYYTRKWLICETQEENLSPVQYAILIGNVMRYFVIGIMVMCVQGYKIDGVTLWSSMIFLMTGTSYLIILSMRKYYIDEDEGNESTEDLNLLEFRVLVFLLILIIVLVVVLASSFTTFARSGLKKIRQPQSYSDLESDDEILGSYPKQRIFSRREIWWRTVNGNKIMRDSPVVYRIFMVPIFFVLAHFIPVISKERFQIGWVKYINVLCFLILPVLCFLHDFSAVNLVVVTIVCWTFSFLVYISTHSMRRPDHAWLYSLLGLGISSLAMCVLSREIDNLIWQFMGLRFRLSTDINALLYLGMGEVFSEALVLRGMQRRKLWDACYGFVMSLTTYGLYLVFPLIYYHKCYNVNCQIIDTASSGTCKLFMLLIICTTLLHISMSGYEFRISLFYYLLGEVFVYVIYQWMRHHDAVFPLTFMEKTEIYT